MTDGAASPGHARRTRRPAGSGGRPASAVPRVARTLSYLDSARPAVPSRRRRARHVRRRRTRPGGASRRRPASLDCAVRPPGSPAACDSDSRGGARWTGEAALNFDLRRASTDEVRTGRAPSAPTDPRAPLLAFGAVAAAVLPSLPAPSRSGSRWAPPPWSRVLSTLHRPPERRLDARPRARRGLHAALVSRFREARAAGADAGMPPRKRRRTRGTRRLSAAAVAIGSPRCSPCRSPTCARSARGAARGRGRRAARGHARARRCSPGSARASRSGACVRRAAAPGTLAPLGARGSRRIRCT